MAKWKKQAHVVYQNAYHLVWCPKYRYRILKGAVGKMVNDTLRLLCEWKQVEVMGVLKGKVAIKLFKSYPTETTSVLGEQNLEQGILRKYDRDGRGKDKALREVPRRQRKRGRGQRERMAPFRGLIPKATCFAGGFFTDPQ